MSESNKFFYIMGLIFGFTGFCGIVVGIVGFASGEIDGLGLLIPLLIGFVFGALGIGFLIAAIKPTLEKKKIVTQGKRYTGKIHSYINDQSIMVNGQFTVNIKVHYFDENDIEREVIVPTGFVRGSNKYPIGATIDIMVLGARCSAVPNSVRFDHIDREEELMDDKPIAAGSLGLTAVSCQGCGASFTAAIGYVSKCPYCGGAVKVEK